ncbi:hypothetical protein HID58_062568, partial [Brassica napus]
MSMIQAFSLLKDVKPYKQGWRVQVKLLHSWRQKTNYGGDTLEMIFTDETGVKIHCSARKTLIKKPESKIRLDVVGQVSSLRNIQTVQVAGNDKKKIEFRLMDINMPNDEFALALTDTKNDKRPIKDQIDDWNDVGIKSISEIIMATQDEDCKIICSIESIDTDWSWFIFVHVSRNRFKLHLIVKDDTIWSGDNILQIESNSEPITHVSSASSIMSGGEVSLTEKSEANSSEGSSTPFSKRKEKDQVDQTSTSKKLCTKVVKMEKIKDDELNRKQGFPPIQRGDSTQQTERITRRKQNSGNLVQVKRSQNQKSIRTLDVPVSTVFKRLFHGVGYIHTDAVSPNVNQGKQLTPCTPRNIIKCATSMDCGTGQASYGTLQRNKAGIRKRLRSGLQDKTNICSFMDRLDETSGDESEEDGNAVAYDSDFEDRFDGNFQENLDCSSQENTDEESDPEIEVVDLTVTKEPNSIPARNR